ncbi:hypothetical protein EVU91_07300 [Macrococcoides bohemicum]|uniref:hypothetical protein n=1 Tax=Macrococcoides bohemicum TaxID=1903056 RepID=UPI001059D511|nr:hypothetical protein [Macrococcus bohemicus]TDL37710.1 hypothetical protein EVU91_07300 [Macrococcus bohemicus]
MKYRAKTLNKYDYKTLERYVINFEKLKHQYKNRPNGMTDSYYKNLGNIVNGIVDAYNQLTLREQQLLKLTWWQKEDDDTISKILNVGKPTLKVFREKILGIVADATGFVCVGF